MLYFASQAELEKLEISLDESIIIVLDDDETIAGTRIVCRLGCNGVMVIPKPGTVGSSTPYIPCLCCKRKACVHCHQELLPGHICDPTTVASITSIMEAVKPCPGCNILTERSEGCSEVSKLASSSIGSSCY